MPYFFNVVTIFRDDTVRIEWRRTTPHHVDDEPVVAFLVADAQRECIMTTARRIDKARVADVITRRQFKRATMI